MNTSINGEDLMRAYVTNTRMGYLSHEEVSIAVEKVKTLHRDLVLQFIEVNYLHPTKIAMVQSVPTPLPRMVEVITLCLETNTTIVDLVDVSASRVNSTEYLKDVQAGISPDEYAFMEILLKSYQPLLDAIARRGVDPQWLVVDAWCCGHTGPDCDPTERIGWPAMYICEPGKDDIAYARPIEGIEIRVSFTQKKVIRFDDSEFDQFVIPGSDESPQSRYVPPDKQRQDLKPLLITQPDGPSWTISDLTTVAWQSWRFQVGFNSREGATINGLTFHGRPVMHKFSFCEMVVPYGDPRSPHCMKNAFDAGEDGLGRNANSLVLGCDCQGEIHYFDAHVVRDDGSINTVKNAICMHEEDTGLAWKHTDWRTGVPFSARGRRLSISFICTIANYEYAFYYHFGLDGSIEGEVRLTGILSTGTLSNEEMIAGGRKYGSNLGGCLYAPIHQHFFVSRMDFVVDGVDNTVVEMNAERETDGPHNPTLNGFFYTSRVLESEKAAVRDCDVDAGRFWKVVNPNVFNSIGGNTGFKIVATAPVKPLADAARSHHLRRAQFLEHALWVTRFDPKEQYPGGDFPNQNPRVDGLPIWVERDASVVNSDVVVWHVFGVTHLPRPEDWPVMPVEHCGFRVKPVGFFTSSVAMDIPASKPVHKTTTNSTNSDSCGCETDS